jgi:hypothetical protein
MFKDINPLAVALIITRLMAMRPMPALEVFSPSFHASASIFHFSLTAGECDNY